MKKLATLLGIAGALASDTSVFGVDRHYKGPGEGAGSGRTAKCKKCGVIGAVERGNSGKRKIVGCTCSKC